MISNLNKSDFINRVKENTKLGDPNAKWSLFAVFTIFGQTQKKFYGEYSDSGFRLTKNAIFFPIPYVIQGTLKHKDKTSTEVELNIKPIWFGYLWIRICPVLALILINFILITKGDNIETEVHIIVNIFLLFMFIPIFVTLRQKNKLLKDFYRIFEISDF